MNVMHWMDTLPLALIGFSIVIGPVLVLAYLRSTLFPKSAYAVTSVVLLTLILILLQLHHGLYFAQGIAPHTQETYIYGLLVAPALFFYVGRFVVSPQASFSPKLLVCLVPCLLPLLVPAELALSVVFLIGAGYAIWFAWVVVSLRALRKQHRFEMTFAMIITVMAAGVFVSSTFLSQDSVFYLFYSQSIGLAYVLVTFALIAIPDFVSDLFELARSKYLSTTLSAIDTEKKLGQLDELMAVRELYRDEGLSLATLAQELELSSHQLSELLNGFRQMSFSAYVKQHRVEAAMQQLIAEPSASVLSIGLDVGFRSQSTFYAAFKAETGLSPGDFRSQTHA